MKRNKEKFLSKNKILKQINAVISFAKKYPNEKFYILWDKTGLLDIENNFIKDLPQNVSLIITSSLTKFQKGETNFFYGIISGYNLSEKEKDILEKVYQKYSYYPQNILAPYFFPRLTKKQITETFNNMESNKRNFIKGLSEGIKDKKLLKNLVLGFNRIGLYLTDFPGIDKYFVQQDTFGMPYTNISSAFGNMRRISFSSNKEKDLYQKGRKIGKDYIKYLKRLDTTIENIIEIL